VTRVPGLKLALFAGLGVLCLWPKIDTPVALIAGILFSLILGNPAPAQTARWSKLILQLSVVGLGFGIGILQVLREGRGAIGYTVVGIGFTLVAGYLIGRRLGVDARTSQLISFGTAICGGSAIAAMAPVIRARNQDIAVALGTVFALNSVALLVFPPIGHLLHLSQPAFGLWAALAIHDTSSVVGAASSFGPVALATATTVKLTRALWITPCVLAAGLITKSGRKATVPLFIVGFVAAATIRALFPQQVWAWDAAAQVARRLLVVTLFLIGAGLSRSVIRAVGLRPLGQGLILWLLVSAATLLAITQAVI
jgi:uncharacterized integral membrane protein (TIGR00698 family)